MINCTDVICPWNGACKIKEGRAVCEMASWVVPVLSIMGACTFLVLLFACYGCWKQRRGSVVVPAMANSGRPWSRITPRSLRQASTIVYAFGAVVSHNLLLYSRSRSV
jgi:hypothetical protein